MMRLQERYDAPSGKIFFRRKCPNSQHASSKHSSKKNPLFFFPRSQLGHLRIFVVESAFGRVPFDFHGRLTQMVQFATRKFKAEFQKESIGLFSEVPPNSQHASSKQSSRNNSHSATPSSPWSLAVHPGSFKAEFPKVNQQ